MFSCFEIGNIKDDAVLYDDAVGQEGGGCAQGSKLDDFALVGNAPEFGCECAAGPGVVDD